MGTDRYAYQSRLRRVSPMPKLLLTAAAMVLCLLCDSVAVGAVTILLMGVLITALGGLWPRVFFHFLKVPLVFLIIGCLTVVAGSYPAGSDLLLALPVGGRLWGVSAQSLWLGARLFCKALGVISAMYFLALNTPVTDITMALERLHVPKLFVELMELIYRFVFVLTEGMVRIRTAQESRLGYRGLRCSLQSAGTLCSMVFLRAWRKADRVYTALESRGYTGSLTTLTGDYAPGRALYPVAAGVTAVQVLVFFVERMALL